jgi:hypothetical protein
MTELLTFLARLLAVVIGFGLVGRVLLSAIRLFLLPRSARDRIAGLYFLVWRKLFVWRANRANTYEGRDAIMAYFAPISLVTLPAFLLGLIALAYTLIYRAVGVSSFYDAFTLSGSSLTTLGFARQDGAGMVMLEFSEAAIGLTLAALLISYLPTMYAAFSAREGAVTLLEVRAGSPPSAVQMLIRSHRIRGLDYLTEVWDEWEGWFAALEESHTSLAALVFFRSPKHDRSWVTAAGTVLDCASIYASTVDRPPNPEAQLCIRAGFLALRAIADFYRIPHNAEPSATDPISVSRAEFEAAYDELYEAGVPVKADREQCWRDFAGWRVNYDTVLLRLAALTMAPYAPWISDRSLPRLQRSHAK